MTAQAHEQLILDGHWTSMMRVPYLHRIACRVGDHEGRTGGGQRSDVGGDPQIREQTKSYTDYWRTGKRELALEPSARPSGAVSAAAQGRRSR